MYFVPLNEQETVIQFSRKDSTVSVWTSDSTQINRMDKLVEAEGSLWECVDVGYANMDGERSIVTKEYRGDKGLLTIRAKKKQLTDEQKAKIAGLARKLPKGKDSSPSEDN